MRSSIYKNSPSVARYEYLKRGNRKNSSSEYHVLLKIRKSNGDENQLKIQYSICSQFYSHGHVLDSVYFLHVDNHNSNASFADKNSTPSIIVC